MARTFVVALTAFALVACSGGGKGSTPKATTTTEPRPPSVKIAVTVGSVHGDLSAEAASALSKQVAGAVDPYFQRAWLTSSISTDTAFATFTPGAAALARQHLDALTLGELARGVEWVRATRYAADLDVFARGGAAHGVTAAIAFEAEGLHRAEGPFTVAMAGSLSLANGDAGWRVIGFDLAEQSRTALSDTVTPTVTTKPSSPGTSPGPP